MIIFGWIRRFTLLGSKLDECANCGQVCPHAVGRKTNWAHVFWIPVLFLYWEHGMACTTCGTWSGIGWRQVRQAMKTGVLHLDRPRPNSPALLAAQAAESGDPPLPLPAMMDRFLINPKRGGWDLWTKAWPVVAAIVIGVGALGAAYDPPASSASGGYPVSGQPRSSTAHTCWIGTDGQLSGCRLSDGLHGTMSANTVTCYFEEVEFDTANSVRCDR